jgi:hypothetical protein
MRGKGPRVPYERCVRASTGQAPEASRPEGKRELVAELLARAGHDTGTPEKLGDAVRDWRNQRLVPRKAIRQLAAAFIALLEERTRRNLVPCFPAELREVPRANIQFLPIEDPGSPVR